MSNETQLSKSFFGSGSGTHTAYAVEIRSTSDTPKQLRCGMIVDREWRLYQARVLRCDRPDHPLTLAEVNGIPVQNLCADADQLNLMDFHAAYALMTTLQAQVNNSGFALSGLCIETRMIQVKITYSYSTNVTKVGEPINLYELKQKMTWENQGENS